MLRDRPVLIVVKLVEHIQCISFPFIVAMMALKAEDVVIELSGAFGEEGCEVWACVYLPAEGSDIAPELFAG